MATLQVSAGGKHEVLPPLQRGGARHAPIGVSRMPTEPSRDFQSGPAAVAQCGSSSDAGTSDRQGRCFPPSCTSRRSPLQTHPL